MATRTYAAEELFDAAVSALSMQAVVSGAYDSKAHRIVGKALAEKLGLELAPELPPRLCVVQGCLRPVGQVELPEPWSAVVAEAARRYNAVSETLAMLDRGPFTAEQWASERRQVLRVLREGGR